jgi:hypothetical protein
MSVTTEPVAGTHAYMTARTDALIPGTRVIVDTGGHLGGKRGVIIEPPRALSSGHDCCVQLDNLGWPLCFYWHELKVAS